jgi:hypothetical protein
MSKALGGLMRDRLTGFTGHATARLQPLHGCPQLQLTALRDGAIHSEWVDEERCEPVVSGCAPAGFAASEEGT